MSGFFNIGRKLGGKVGRRRKRYDAVEIEEPPKRRVSDLADEQLWEHAREPLCTLASSLPVGKEIVDRMMTKERFCANKKAFRNRWNRSGSTPRKETTDRTLFRRDLRLIRTLARGDAAFAEIVRRMKSKDGFGIPRLKDVTQPEVLADEGGNPLIYSA